MQKRVLLTTALSVTLVLAWVLVGESWSPQLIVDGKQFYLTSSNKEFLEEVKDNLEKICPDTNFEIKDFGVEIINADPSTNQIEWKRKKGFSLWYSPLGTLPHLR